MHQGSDLSEAAPRGNRANTRGTHGGHPRVSDVPRGPRADRGGRKHTEKEDQGQYPIRGTQNGQKPVVDRSRS
jgi:hypothetical protein